jgi:hypothetical protein
VCERDRKWCRRQRLTTPAALSSEQQGGVMGLSPWAETKGRLGLYSFVCVCLRFCSQIVNKCVNYLGL